MREKILKFIFGDSFKTQKEYEELLDDYDSFLGEARSNLEKVEEEYNKKLDEQRFIIKVLLARLGGEAEITMHDRINLSNNHVITAYEEGKIKLEVSE